MPTRAVGEVIQNRNFISVTQRTSARSAAKLMKEHHTSAILVIDHRERLVGICTERDIVFDVVAERLDPDHVQVGAIMTAQPRTIASDKPFGHALHLMFEGGFRHVPVVDGDGRPVGILSARDALASDALQFGEDLVRREEITVIL